MRCGITGRPRLTDTQLLQLLIVEDAMTTTRITRRVPSARYCPRPSRSETGRAAQHDGNRMGAVQHYRHALVQGRKVREVTQRLAMSDANLFRKQQIAIAEVAQKVAEMERKRRTADSDPSPLPA